MMAVFAAENMGKTKALGRFMYLENACEMLSAKDLEDEYPLQIQMNRCF